MSHTTPILPNSLMSAPTIVLATFIINPAQNVIYQSQVSYLNGSNANVKPCITTVAKPQICLICHWYRSASIHCLNIVRRLMVNVSCNITRQLNRTLDTDIRMKWKRVRLPKKRGKLKENSSVKMKSYEYRFKNWQYLVYIPSFSFIIIQSRL